MVFLSHSTFFALPISNPASLSLVYRSFTVVFLPSSIELQLAMAQVPILKPSSPTPPSPIPRDLSLGPGKLFFFTFLAHFLLWLGCCSFLFCINLLTTLLLPPWFLFPTIGWGIGLALHGVTSNVVCHVCKDSDFSTLCDEMIINNAVITLRRMATEGRNMRVRFEGNTKIN